jgi:hypothetical protein
LRRGPGKLTFQGTGYKALNEQDQKKSRLGAAFFMVDRGNLMYNNQ